MLNKSRWIDKSMGVCAQSLSHVQLLVTPWTVAHQASLSIEFPRQDYLSELPFPSPGDHLDPGIKPTSPAWADVFFITDPPGKPIHKSIILEYLGKMI